MCVSVSGTSCAKGSSSIGIANTKAIVPDSFIASACRIARRGGQIRAVV